jgi:hypothetical protein
LLLPFQSVVFSDAFIVKRTAFALRRFIREFSADESDGDAALVEALAWGRCGQSSRSDTVRRYRSHKRPPGLAARFADRPLVATWQRQIPPTPALSRIRQIF